MLETGAISRLVALIKTIAPQDQVVQIMIINVGFGTLLAAMGATPVSILPPIMLRIGLLVFRRHRPAPPSATTRCVPTPCWACRWSFSPPLSASQSTKWAQYFARYMPIISTCIALGMLWIVGKWKMVANGLLPALISGLTAGLSPLG